MTVATERAADFDYLQTALRIALRGRVRNLSVTPRDDGVELDGEATSYHVIQLVIRDVLTAGIPICRNHIRVRSTS